MSHFCVLAFIVAVFFCTVLPSLALTDKPHCPDPQCCRPVPGNQTRSCAIVHLACPQLCYATCANGQKVLCSTNYNYMSACRPAYAGPGERECSNVDRGCGDVWSYPMACAECDQDYARSLCNERTGKQD